MRARVETGVVAAQRPIESLAYRRIMGVDPSLRRTGIAIIEVGPRSLEALVYDAVECPRAWSRSRCLASIFQRVDAFATQERPDVCVFEGLFFVQNLKTALSLGEARGAALAAAAGRLEAIFEVAPRRVKKSVVGFGAASKEAVAEMTRRALGMKEAPGPDESDALAIALAFHYESNQGLIRESNPI